MTLGDRQAAAIAALESAAPARRARISAMVIAATVAIVAGCGSSTPPASDSLSSPLSDPSPSSQRSSVPSAQSSPPPVLGIDWGRATSVEAPKNFEVGPSDPPYHGTHPILRLSGQATIADVTGLPGGGFVAVGYIPPDWVPAAWTSADGLTWTIHYPGTTTFTFPVSVAAGPSGTVVAVGRTGSQPVAWTSADGAEWQERTVPILGAGVAERMTTVVAGGGSFIAGGSLGPELFERHARFWSSADGATWQTAPDDPVAFANAEVRAITPFEAGYVAVGVVGTAQHPSGAVAWTSTDGSTWTRIDDPAFVDAVAVAVVAAPFGGLVAVGSDVARHEAVAWTSPDGRRWTRAPNEPSREHSGGYAWMTDVIAIGDSVIGVGDYQGLQRGTATSWVSKDGIQWTQARSAPVQEQGEFYAITAGGPGAIVVGSFGAPDSYVPTIWVSPAR